MSFVSFFKQLLLNYQKYWMWLKFLMVAKWTHVIFPLPQFSATVLLHSTWNVHLLLITNKWGVLLDFHLPLFLSRTIRRTTEKLRYYQIESFEQSRELSLSFVWEQAFYRRLIPGNGPSESVPFADHFVCGSRAVLQLLSDRR